MRKESRRSLMISFLALLMSMPVSAYDFECDGIYYDLLEDPYDDFNGRIEDNTLAVVSGDSKYRGDIFIPSEVTINGTTYRVTAIGHIGQAVQQVFFDCSELTSVTIPESVTYVSYDAFMNCSALASLKVESGNQHYDSRDNCNAIIETFSNTLIAGCKNTTIPDNVTTIDGCAFWGCTDLTSITIPSSVTTIGFQAFRGCGLTSVTIPGGVLVRDYAFMDCSGLTSVSIQGILTRIGHEVFANCMALNSVTIDQGVIELGNQVFENCTSLTTVSIPNSVYFLGSGAFSGCTNLRTIVSEIENPFAIEGICMPSNMYTTVELVVPVGTKARYEQTPGWKKFAKITEGTSDINGIPTTTAAPEGYFTLDGCRLKSPTKGINIIRQSDGTTRKVIVR